MSPELVIGAYVFILAIFVGFEVVSKVPSTLHTPLMSGANAIHGIVIVGAMLVASAIPGPVGAGSPEPAPTVPGAVEPGSPVLDGKRRVEEH